MKFCGMEIAMCFQRKVLREATVYPTIAMGLHFFVAIREKLILQSLQSWRNPNGLADCSWKKHINTLYKSSKIRANFFAFIGRKLGTAPYTTTLHPPLFRSNCSIPKVYIPPCLQILRVAPRLQIGCNPDTINDCNCPSVPFRLFHRPNSHGHSLQDQPLWILGLR